MRASAIAREQCRPRPPADALRVPIRPRLLTRTPPGLSRRQFFFTSGEPPDRIAAAGRRRRLPRRHTGDAGTDSQRANQNRRGNGRKKANRTGGCKERLRRRRRNVSMTHRPRNKRSPSSPVSFPFSAARTGAKSPRILGRFAGAVPMGICGHAMAIARLGLVPFKNRCCKDQTVTTSEAQILSRIARIHVFAHAAQTTHAWGRGAGEGTGSSATTRVPILRVPMLTRCVGSDPYDKSRMAVITP